MNQKNTLFLVFLWCSASMFAQDFGPEQELTWNSTSGTTHVISEDLDSDGDIDIVSAARYDNKIIWFQNSGTATFSDQIVISDDLVKLVAISAADLDGDFDIDIISASEGDDKIAWYTNDGFGQFSGEHIITLDADSVQNIDTNDFDNDGDMDIVSASFLGDKIVWYSNDGQGNFIVAQVLSSLEFGCKAVFSADLDNDNDIDIVGGSFGSDEEDLFWFENLGAGNFSSSIIIPTYMENINSICVVDFELDGDEDIVASAGNILSGKVFWFANDGLGNFTFVENLNEGTVYPSHVFSADMDNDGDDDILTSFSSSIGWFKNQHPVGFQYFNINSDPNDVRAVSADDLDGDGDVDAISASLDGKIAWYENDGIGDFGELELISITAYSPTRVFGFDFDNDNDLDVVSSLRDDETIIVYVNDGLGSFSDKQILATAWDAISDLITSDLDIDGDLDLVYVGENRLAWFENIGNGNFSAVQSISNSIDDAYTLVSSDLDNDMDMDIITTSYSNDNVLYFKNDGTGEFGPAQILSDMTQFSRAVATADVDGDNDNDIVGFHNGFLVWFENSGNATFPTIHILFDPNSLRYLLCPDLDQDGDADLLIGEAASLSWMKNDGAGNFGTKHILTTEIDLVTEIFASDMDGDGDIDILSSSSDDHKIAWYENIGWHLYSGQKIISSTSMEASSVFAGDFDGDGDVDVLGCSEGDDEISIYESFLGYGCTDANACNYSSFFNFDDGSCCYDDCGCTNVLAANFSPMAQCDDGSCLYTLSGFVFQDDSLNGIWNSWEYPSSLQTLVLDQSEIMAISNGEGEFAFSVGEGMYDISRIPTEAYPFTSTVNPASVIVNGVDPPLIPEIGASTELNQFDLEVSIQPNTGGCNIHVLYYVVVKNAGNIAIDGTIELTYNSLIDDYSEYYNIDSVSGANIYMSFGSLLPGQCGWYGVYLQHAGPEYSGEIIAVSADVHGFVNGAEVVSGYNQKSITLSCSYDPNDKNAYPQGYSDAHYILNNSDSLEYVIRFQNVGDAPATNVLIRDTLDTNLDIGTFALTSATHTVLTTLNPVTRVLELLFVNIMLPDSTSDEPGSHGLVSYRIDLVPGLQAGTTINNTAYIFFDNNEAIITNTTLYTIYECSTSMSYFLQDEFELTAIDGIAWQWYMDGIPIPDATSQIYTVLESGYYSVMVTHATGCTDISEEVFVGHDGLMDQIDFPIIIYPNPMHEECYLKIPNPGSVTKILLLNSIGSIVNEWFNPERSFVINRGSLAPGVYSVKVETNHGNSILKLVVE